MKYKKNAIVLIYVLFLVTISVIFASILLNNNSYLFNINSFFEINSKLYSNIDSDTLISININREVNKNGWWFIDNMSCPWWANVSMSGSFNTALIWTTLINSGSIYCEWTYLSKSLKLYFNTWSSDFDVADYDWYIVSLTNWLGDANFWDSDNTLIDFSAYNYFVSDWFDDDYNSDNYKVTSTWNTSTWIYYNDWFQDDDNKSRKQLFGYVPLDYGFKKVFWNTSKVLKIINDNTNNNDSLNEKLWDVSNWFLHFDIDKNSDFKLVKLDKSVYDETKELIKLETLTGSILANIWYLQNNLWVLSLSPIITWNEYSFDFINNDYVVFLKLVWTWTLLYNITWETNTGTWIYINPMDDSNSNYIKILWNEILIDSNWVFISNESELIYKK